MAVVVQFLSVHMAVVAVSVHFHCCRFQFMRAIL